MDKPAPTYADIPYGPHPRNTLDIWLSQSNEPAPMLVWIHGGGFYLGNKNGVRPTLVNAALDAGMAVASINYRFSQQAPFPAPMLDGGRALQFLRSRAEEFNIDPSRIAAGGSSAGGGISLWLGFHEDLADPTSEDLVARESTRPNCLLCYDAQSSYDPNYICEIIGPNAGNENCLQMLFRARPEDFANPDKQKMFTEASAITHATADAPPVFACYARRNIPPTPELDSSYGIHHPRFGEVLKDKLDSLGVECVLRIRDEYPDATDEQMAPIFDGEAIEFAVRQFGLD